MGKNKDRRWNLMVVGAGAAGMMAAITAARNGKKVILFEKSDKVGKKLYATGNGKCNFTNRVMNTGCYHGNEALIQSVLNRFTVEDCLEFFHSIGIYPKGKNGYFYPCSEQADAVVTALSLEMERLGVTVYCDTTITDICPDESGITLKSSRGVFSGDRLLIATGLLAAPKLGSDGSFFTCIKSLGHTFHPILPALCGFYCKGMHFKTAAGVRVTGTVEAFADQKPISKDTGEIQFTDYGVSGIPVFQISSAISKALYHKKDVAIVLRLLPELTEEQLLEELRFRRNLFSGNQSAYLLNGLIPRKLIGEMCRKANISEDISAGDITDKDLTTLVHVIKGITLKVTKWRDFEFAQVCTGGIPTEEIDVSNLESVLVPHIFFAGEIIDVDGICGGYNLHFAWATGYIAGTA